MFYYLYAFLPLVIALLAFVVVFCITLLIIQNKIRKNEEKLLASIERREEIFTRQPLLTFGTKNWNLNKNIKKTELVVGEIVIGYDSFKQLLAILHKIIGGEMKSLNSLFNLGCREAILRMREKAPYAHAIIGVKVKTVPLDSINEANSTKYAITATGTAVTLSK